jgi:hypothetical protein
MKREAFRRRIDADLKRMGYKPGSWIWQTAPARLTICLDGAFRDIPIKANMKKEDLSFQLGRLAGWAEMMGLLPQTDTPAPAKPRRSRQIDIEEAIAGATA